ncbi:MAG TPA: DUF368 domain-containing protein, partial [Methanocorpusculum sp.]|nr:DUF368 domain-containing protein [Methanocorpusculum sp.]
MAIADSVPGVSGGTIAFLLGFYEKFIYSIDKFLTGTTSERISVFPFLFKLGLGWITCFYFCVKIISTIFKTHFCEISSMFIGLTLVSIPIVISEELISIKGRLKYIWLTVIGIIFVPLLVKISQSSSYRDLNEMSPTLVIYVFIAAICAISALVLPGISGATILLIFGLYSPIMSACNDTLHGNLNYIPILIVFAVGAIIGFAIITKIMRFCFRKYHSQVIYLCLGLLIGSIYAIWNGNIDQHMSIDTFSIL